MQPMTVRARPMPRALLLALRLTSGLTLSLISGALAHPVSTWQGNSAGRYAQLSPQQLASQLERKDFVLINVHIPYQGELPRTDLFIAFDQIETSAALPRDKAAEIVLYCRSGRMSALAVQSLLRRGYTNVRELKGGFDAWTSSQKPLVNKGRG